MKLTLVTPKDITELCNASRLDCKGRDCEDCQAEFYLSLYQKQVDLATENIYKGKQT